MKGLFIAVLAALGAYANDPVSAMLLCALAAIAGGIYEHKRVK